MRPWRTVEAAPDLLSRRENFVTVGAHSAPHGSGQTTVQSIATQVTRAAIQTQPTENPHENASNPDRRRYHPCRGRPCFRRPRFLYRSLHVGRPRRRRGQLFGEVLRCPGRQGPGDGDRHLRTTGRGAPDALPGTDRRRRGPHRPHHGRGTQPPADLRTAHGCQHLRAGGRRPARHGTLLSDRRGRRAAAPIRQPDRKTSGPALPPWGSFRAAFSPWPRPGSDKAGPTTVGGGPPGPYATSSKAACRAMTARSRRWTTPATARQARMDLFPP